MSLRNIFIVFGKTQFTHVVIACNTAHLFASEIEELLKTKVESLIETTCVEAIKMEGIVGILASPQTIESKLHKQLFNRDVLTLSKAEQQETSQVIHAVIGGDIENSSSVLRVQINKLLKKGAQKVVLGCTELSVLNEKHNFKKVIDPLNIVVERILK
jgi:aspartate racemase